MHPALLELTLHNEVQTQGVLAPSDPLCPACAAQAARRLARSVNSEGPDWPKVRRRLSFLGRGVREKGKAHDFLVPASAKLKNDMTLRLQSRSNDFEFCFVSSFTNNAFFLKLFFKFVNDWTPDMYILAYQGGFRIGPLVRPTIDYDPK